MNIDESTKNSTRHNVTPLVAPQNMYRKIGSRRRDATNLNMHLQQQCEQRGLFCTAWLFAFCCPQAMKCPLYIALNHLIFRDNVEFIHASSKPFICTDTRCNNCNYGTEHTTPHASPKDATYPNMNDNQEPCQ
ncbi:unnamed protein product [Ixodes pacificus]